MRHWLLSDSKACEAFIQRAPRLLEARPWCVDPSCSQHAKHGRSHVRGEEHDRAGTDEHVNELWDVLVSKISIPGLADPDNAAKMFEMYQTLALTNESLQVHTQPIPEGDFRPREVLSKACA